jgi:hypothetical protein
MGTLEIQVNNDPTEVFDRHYTLDCPHCQARSGISAMAIPRWEFLDRFRPKEVGIAYICNSCKGPIFLVFRVIQYHARGDRYAIRLFDDPAVVQQPAEHFDFQYLPDDLASDFREALGCYSILAYNAFAAMCRRTVQSASMALGVEGTTKVKAQLLDLKSMAVIDEETFDLLEQIILDGHDGAHPHLPELSPERARVLLDLMRDVLYQLFVRRAKIKEAEELRRQAIAQT